jgi:hypothetical protein
MWPVNAADSRKPAQTGTVIPKPLPLQTAPDIGHGPTLAQTTFPEAVVDRYQPSRWSASS